MSKSTLYTISAFLLIGGLGLTYMIMNKSASTESQKFLADKVQLLKDKTSKLKKIFKEKKKISEEGKSPDVPDVYEAKLSDSDEQVGGTQEKKIVITTDSTDCESVNAKILNLFSLIDQRNYVKGHQLEKGTYAFFKDIVTKLSNKKPVPGEEFEPEDILKNAYHFYRTISKNNIILIKTIIEKENNIVEQTLHDFYQQHMLCDDNQNLLPPFVVLYEYAHFFWKTLGGKAYLFRLDSKNRILMLYYSTLIIHEANIREINKYGLDINPLIHMLENDLKSYSKVFILDGYLSEIKKIKEFYEAPQLVKPS